MPDINAPTRDGHRRHIVIVGGGYASIATAIKLLGPKLRARTYAGQQGEAALAVQELDQMIREAKPVTIRHH